LIEFLYACSNGSNTILRIVNENGALLKTINDCNYASVFWDGTSTKLNAQITNGKSQIYSLPGQLVTFTHSLGDLELTELAYPNPTHSTLTIPYKLPEGSSQGELMIQDLSGRVIKSYLVDKTFSNIKINVAELPAGAYLYNVKAGSSVSKTEKFVIQ
jgi:hypothetical protein